MNWNNEGYRITSAPIIFTNIHWIEQVNANGNKRNVEFWGWSEFDFTPDDDTVAIWRKKKPKCSKCSKPAQVDHQLCVTCEQRHYEYLTEKADRGF